MDLNRFLKYFGLLFVMIGVVIGGFMTVSSILTGSLSMIFMGLSFLVLFGGIGGFFAWYGISAIKRDEKIAAEGVAIMGKIFDYVPDYQMTLNGQPSLSIVVRYKKDGLIRESIVRTGYTDTAAIPRGATVTISILNGEAAFVPGSVSDVKLPDEENLLNPDIDPEKIESSIGASCPACGATLIVPIGMSAICPYCGRKVVVGKDGSIR